MPKKSRTTKEFKDELYLINPNIEVLGEFTKAVNPIKVRCKIDGHIWYPPAISLINKRHSSGCPVCANLVIVKGINDMWTTNPEMAKLLANPEDGYKYSQSSGVRLDWICPECLNLIKNKKVANINSYGLSCSACGDGISLGMKFATNVLASVTENFETEKTFDWLPNRKYDLYIETTKTIIEVNGGQHYDNSFEACGGRTNKEEKENDILKENKAIKNGIKNYIKIDSRKTDLDCLVYSIKNSELSKLYDLSSVNWEQCYKKSQSSLVVEACNLFNNNFNILQISNMLRIDRSTVNRYLTRGFVAGICHYNSEESNKTKVVCVNNGEIFDSIKEAELKYNASHISCCCIGKRLYSGQLESGDKLKWMYLDDYNNFSDLEKYVFLNRQSNLSKFKRVICLENGNVFNSVKDAASYMNLKTPSNIAQCCRKERKHAADLTWMFYNVSREHL